MKCKREKCKFYDVLMTDNCAKGEAPNVEECQLRRSSLPDVRNPLLALPGAEALQGMTPEAKAGLRTILLDIRKDAQAKAEKCWRTHKAPMAAYWKAVAVYAGHTARLLRAA